MGSANSSNQENMEENSDTGDSSNSEQEPDIVSILQYLIRNNAEIGILSTNEMEKFSDDSEDESNCDMQSDLDQSESVNKIEGSEFEQDTLLKSGAVRKSGFNRPNNLTKMVNQREMGMYGSQQFTKGDCCLVSAGFLPNTSRVIHNYHNKVFCGTYSQDGRLFLTACQDRCLRLYNCESRNIKLFKTVEARDVGWSVLDTAFSPDGNHFVYSSWSECIHLCSIYGRNEFHHSLPLNPEARRFCIFSLMFSQDGSEVLGGANDGCLYVYDIDRARRTLKIQSHDDDVNTVAFADDTSQILFSGGDDGICRVWDRRTLDESHPKPVGVLAGHRDGITFIDSRNDGRHLITNCKDQSIKLWDMRVFSPSEGLENTKRAVSSYVWDYRWQSVPRKFSSLNKTSKRLSGDTSLMTYMGHKVLQTLIRCRFSPAFTTGQRYIYTGCSSGKVIIYDALTGTKVKELKNHRSCVRDVSWHPFKSEIVSTSWDSTIVHWTYEEDLCDDPDIETIVSDVTNRKTQNPLRKRKTYNLRPRNTSRYNL